MLSLKGQRLTGIGRVVDNSNTIYEGQLKNGAPHGFGRKIFGNAQYYIGRFENGEVHGFGTLYDSFDRVLEQGTWFKG